MTNEECGFLLSPATTQKRSNSVQPDCCFSFFFLRSLKKPPEGGLQGWCQWSPGSVPGFQHYQLLKAVQSLRNHSKSLCGLCLCSYQLHNCQFKPLTSQSALDCTEGFSCLTIATFSVISPSTFPLSVSQGTIRNCKRQERFQRKDSSVWCFQNVACQPLMKKKAFCEERY